MPPPRRLIPHSHHQSQSRAPRGADEPAASAQRIKESPENKERLKQILKDIADIVEDPNEGRVLVLKQ